MGSIGIAIYRSELADRLPPGVPAEAAEAARDTLGSAAAVAAQLPGELGAAVLQAAREAFVAGMQLSSAIAAGIGVALAVLALVVLRNQEPTAPRRGRGAEVATATAGRRRRRRRRPLAGGAEPAAELDEQEREAERDEHDAREDERLMTSVIGASTGPVRPQVCGETRARRSARLAAGHRRDDGKGACVSRPSWPATRSPGRSRPGSGSGSPGWPSLRSATTPTRGPTGSSWTTARPGSSRSAPAPAPCRVRRCRPTSTGGGSPGSWRPC